MAGKFHLGDGAYAGVEHGTDVVLQCDRENGRNWVAMDPSVLASFGMWLRAGHPHLADHLAENLAVDEADVEEATRLMRDVLLDFSARWPELLDPDNDEEVNGGDLIEWMGQGWTAAITRAIAKFSGGNGS